MGFSGSALIYLARSSLHPKQEGGGLQARPRLQPSDVGVDWNREEEKDNPLCGFSGSALIYLSQVKSAPKTRGRRSSGSPEASTK